MIIEYALHINAFSLSHIFFYFFTLRMIEKKRETKDSYVMVFDSTSGKADQVRTSQMGFWI